jgi:hypothetical protein
MSLIATRGAMIFNLATIFKDHWVMLEQGISNGGMLSRYPLFG